MQSSQEARKILRDKQRTDLRKQIKTVERQILNALGSDLVDHLKNKLAVLDSELQAIAS